MPHPQSQSQIDQRFVHDLFTGPNDAAMVDTIIALSRRLGPAMMAEGLGSPGQRDLLAPGGATPKGSLFAHGPSGGLLAP
ncbi:EAL domain-containing protein [Acidovorax sp. JHL-9]|uniref:EAL domain-containing protein n=1 Tax=Acidovorax sp. JHL-9 TaxID=1276756 RepID=UPI0004204B76|nr:EAL domain-containing protein [Acidovorax sp. JHL-9]